MKPYIIIIVLLVLITRAFAGEIPNDFIKSDNPLLKAYFKTLLVFPESRITLGSFVDCLKFPHVCTRGNDEHHDIMTNIISLSDTKLLPRQAFWELKQQTGYNIDLDDKYGTLYINWPKSDVLK